MGKKEIRKVSIDFDIDTYDKLCKYADSVDMGISPIVNGLFTALLNASGSSMDYLFNSLIERANQVGKMYCSDIGNNAMFFAEKHSMEVTDLALLAQYIEPVCNLAAEGDYKIVAGPEISLAKFKTNIMASNDLLI